MVSEFRGENRVNRAITFSAVMKGSGEGKTIHPDVGIPFNLFLPMATAICSHQTRIVGSFLLESGSLFGMGWIKNWGCLAMMLSSHRWGVLIAG